jgi:monoamine oxidase
MITRRRFLSLAAAPALISPSAAAQALEATGRVVVVGAGLAGLHAADLLRKRGREVVVLEARTHAGGRVLTIRSPFDDSLHGEAGASRIAAAHTTVLQLAREHRLTVVPFESPAGSPVVNVAGSRIRSDRFDRVTLPLDLRADEKGLSPSALLDRYAGNLPADLADPSRTWSSQWQAYDRQSWPEWLQSRGASPAAIRLITIGGDSSGLSALYVLRQFALLRNTTRFYKIRGGMDLLPRAMAASLGAAVRYGAEVVRVDRTSRMLRVEFLENGRLQRIEAGDLILAIPFSTLRRIEMRPPLPRRKARAVDELEYFPSTRFLLQTKIRFWQDEGLNGAARTDRPAELWDCAYDQPATRGLLGATVGGALGRAMLRTAPEQCVAIGKEIAADAFPKIVLNFEKGVVYRWALEPWSRGGFAVFRPGQMTALMADIGGPEGRVHFAGEHTSAWMGWMEGALQSGERAAREVMKIS